MSVWIFALIALWPLAGLTVLALMNLFLAKAGKPILPDADQPTDILLRLYLWPIICWRIRAALRNQDKA